MLRSILLLVAAVSADDGEQQPTVEGRSPTPAATEPMESVLLHQLPCGGWPKNYDRRETLTEQRRAELRRPADDEGTIDNGATYSEIRMLAKANRTADNPRYRAAAERGVEYLLEAQYDHGGWPQRYPNPRGYSRYITFNDNAMIGVLELLDDIAAGRKDFEFAAEPLRRRCREAVTRGVDCILRCQIRVQGRPTVWCAQHDHVTFEPRPARSYELASFSGAESARVASFLTRIEPPSPAVIEAVEGAAAWFGTARLTGVRLEKREDPAAPGGFDLVLVEDPQAPPLWARFYDLETGRPIFCDRDGKSRETLAEISHERRNGYSWLGQYAERFLERDLPAWRRKVGRD